MWYVVSPFTQFWTWKAESFSQGPGLSLDSTAVSRTQSELACPWVPEHPSHPLAEASVHLAGTCDRRSPVTLLRGDWCEPQC